MLKLYDEARADYAKQTEAAEQFAGSKDQGTKGPKDQGPKGLKDQEPKGPKDGDTKSQKSEIRNLKSEIPELAAWTAVGNVLLNLDETLMRP